jgi:dipeptidyl aminopeptidase/acylaminoacyl peptidase
VATAARLGLSGAISISPDNQKLAYCERVASATDVHIISLEDGNHSDEVHRGSTSAMDDHGPDSTLPLWRDDGKEIYVVRKGTLWRVAVGGGADTRIERIPGREISSVVGVDRHRRSLVVMTYDDVGKRNGFYALDLRTGTSTLLHEAAEVYGSTDAFNEEGVAVAKGGTRLSYVAESAGSPPDIWTADIGFTKCVRATEINPLLSEYKMGSVQRITWLSADGEPLAGALLLPAEYQAGHRYPLVVNVYGGSRLSDYMNRFGGLVIPYDNIQLLATRGYAVLMPDAPQHEGTPMLDLAKTVLGGVNKAIELGVADADRVGVMGSSYGGYSVLSLLVQTNRFRAAVETSGFAEIPGLYGEMKEDGSAFGLLAEHGQELMGGTLWEFRDRYIENSPLFFLDRVETPLLIVHGEQDSGVGVFLGDQIFVSLRRLGKEVEYGKYRNEGHAFFGLANQEDAANRIINWFDRHLKGTAQSSSP